MEINDQIKIETILNESILSIEDTNKGLTNKNYHVQTEHYNVVVRIPHQDSSNIVYRDHEALALDCIKPTQLDVNTIYYNPKDGIKITEYVPDLLTFKEYKAKDRIIRTAQLMKRLHSLNQCIGFEFNPIERYLKYRKNVKHPMIDDSFSDSIVHTLESIKRPHTLCHNDWVAGNICFSQTRDYLIDYEYAGDNDPFFDVMSFITENDLTDQEKEEFILSYFGKIPNPEEQALLKTYEQFHNLLWCTWACMMAESRNEDIYREIALDKYNALKKI